MTKHFSLVAYVLLACCLALAGCSKKAATGSQVFDQAPSDVKATWEQAVAADQTNDYVAAINGYHSLMAQKTSLSAPQVEAVNAAALAINQRMYAAANNGDEAAKAASAQLLQSQNAH